ncbi:MAG: pilus assembly protein [Xylophilus ampelinus]
MNPAPSVRGRRPQPRVSGGAGALRRQRGIAAVEFALIFPVFFVMLYAIVTYGVILATQQAITLAAAEAGRAALRYPAGATSSADSIALRRASACGAAQAQLAWLAGGLGAGCAASASAAGVSVQASACPYGTGAGVSCLTVTVRYDYAGNPLLPRLLGALSLPTPDQLVGRAVVQVHPSYLL